MSASLNELAISVNRKNMKRARIKIEHDLSVHVSVPLSWSDEAVNALLERNRSWINDKRTQLAAKQQSYDIKNDEIFYRGAVWQNVIVPVLGSHVNVDSSSDLRIYSGRRLQGEALAAWYKAEAKFILPARLRQLAEAHGFEYKKCVIKPLLRKWGSWRSDGVITLNSRLILAPEAVSDAIMLHELAHSAQPNHSKQFWTLLYKLCPSWDKSSAWLEAHSAILLGQ
jgi:predicted metal-dependent hydrolase